MSFTSSIGLMAIFIVDLVDMLFISMLGHRELAAAVGYSGAVLFFTTSFGIGMSIAAGAMVAKALGAGDSALAQRRASAAVIFGGLLGALFALIVWLNLPALVTLVGASGETLNYAVEYLSIIIPSLPILIVAMICGAVLRAHGNARGAMMSTLVGGAVNAVLDPILIFSLGLDLDGAAIASVIARISIAVTALMSIYRFHGGLLMPHKKELVADCAPLLAIAVPAILTQLATPIGQAFITRQMATFGEEAVAGMAVVGRLTPVAFAVVFALSGAVGPIIGQNFGAQSYSRVRQVFRESLGFVAVFVSGMTLLLYLLREPIAQLFQVHGVALELVFLFCGPLALGFIFNGAIFVYAAGFNNLGHPYYSTWINWGRHTLGTIPFVLLGSAWYGAKGVLIGQMLGGLVFAIIAWLMMRRVLRTLGQTPLPERALFSREGRLMQLFTFHR